MLDDELSVASMNSRAERWLAELIDPGWVGTGALPAPVQAVVARIAHVLGQRQ